jgi:hypothetical protein
MNSILRAASWSVFGLCLSGLACAAAPASGNPPPQTVVLHVAVDAAGHVQSAEPVDPQAVPGLVQAARGYAQKLVFTPARKDGAAVASETNLSLVLAVEPVGDGKFALKLKRAVSVPGVVSVGRMDVPKYQGRRGGATIIVSVNVDANGVPDAASIKTESAQLRDPNAFAEARYLDAIHLSVKGSRFAPDKVAGQPVPSRLTLPYQFGMGGAKPKPGEDEEDRRKPPTPPDPSQQPAMSAVSTVPSIELPKLDYRAPAASG